jgi:hypothetical protein
MRYNKYSFLALPLTTSPKPNPSKLPVGAIAGKQAFTVLSQLRNIDSRRLYQKISWMAPDQMDVIRAENPACQSRGFFKTLAPSFAGASQRPSVR